MSATEDFDTQFCSTLNPGAILHHGHGARFTRCTVVTASAQRLLLLPVALVGSWPAHHLPHPDPRGRLTSPDKTVRAVLERRPFSAAARDVYEAPTYTGCAARIDPTVLPEVNLVVPLLDATDQWPGAERCVLYPLPH